MPQSHVRENQGVLHSSVSVAFFLPEETCMRRKALGMIAGHVLECSCPTAEVHRKTPPVISTPHHLAFQLLGTAKVHRYILLPVHPQSFLFNG